MNHKLFLGIETSCDETAIALIEASGGLKAPRFKIVQHELASQVKIHRPFGGVVPNLAKREHLKNLPILYRKIFGAEKKEIALWKKIDAVVVTIGPGLEPALWAGIEFAKTLAKNPPAGGKKPIIGVNHLEGHLYSFLLPILGRRTSIKIRTSDVHKCFPAIALIVSGGHTILLYVKSLKEWERLGETRDDAVGEAFDKVARLLGLPYPGGPELEKMARKGNPEAISFPRPMADSKDYDFSFSGLKTAVLYYLRDNPKARKTDVAASFQKAAIDVLVAKTIRATREFPTESVILSGGVAANKLLREELTKATRKENIRFLVSDAEYNTDNAVMIAAAGYFTMLRKSSQGGSASGGKKYKLSAQGNLDI